ncbi:carboxymuconolactone decarboxylase family protein [Isoalcanivorax beigongshangi]|uniref:Carboxymuconolactone decarboxylase family protein n=1 Tax=Isoalcanivorax beigongshangi TaxID=3238810 RepID=A0ABV4AD69_9GAMM
MAVDPLIPPGGWAGPDRVRLDAPPPRRQGWLLRVVGQASRLFGRNQLPNVFPLLHRHPRLFWGWLVFAAQMMPFGTLSGRQREALILRTAWLNRSRYEWAQHVEIALREGLTATEIHTLALAPTTSTDPDLALLLRCCDALHQAPALPDELWQPLLQRHGERGALEVMMLVGHYRMLAAVLNSSGLPLEPSIEAALADFHRQLSSH